VRLLITRPEPDAQRTAATLRARGHTVILAPLMRVEPIASVQIGAGPWAAILVTSANAAHAIAANENRAALIGVPLFAVGERSAQAMRAVGFADVTSAAGNVNDLAKLVATRLKPPARLLYLAGEERSGDLAGDVRAKGFAVETVVVYRAVAAAVLPQAAGDALASGVDGVLHFSRRSAEAYVNAARCAGLLAMALKAAHFCLSSPIAEPLERAGAEIIRIAPTPTEAALIDLVGSNLQ